MKEALDIEVHGIVQGVGFRPFIYKIARRHLINGWVLNATAGVFIHAEGESKDIDDFVMEISDNAPAASRVDEILMKEVPLEDFESFTIRYSDEAEAEATTLVSPDLATCDECAAELFDPANRRYHYPFINCTNCGPRFTIINKLPYDRKYTSMAAFPMCEQCATEYADPEDRRFHAQPDACFECGPHLIWRTVDHNANAQEDLERVKAEESSFAENGTVKEGRIAPFGVDLKASDAIIDAAVRILRVGGIVAIKGLGGFHLACDARNREALATLRARKRRGTKPLAAMYPTLDALREDCLVSNAEERLLTGAQRPIVLLKKRVEAHFAEGLADGLSELGAMLPYTPLQHLLLTAFGGPLVMTSGNLHDEPIQTDDDKAFVALHDIADAFVGNNRPIRCRFDDSVVRVIKAGSAGEAVQMVRRARGYAPMPVPLKREAEKDGAQSVTFAAGPEQKNTFCLLRGEEAFVSQHIGDLENAPTYDAWLEAKNHYETLFEAQPENIACDLHPEYLASKWAATAHENGTPLCKVQHHHAHIAAVMAENNLDEAVIGVAFDGTGYGADGAIWGGEVMLCNRSDYERFANFSYLPLPGGAAAIKNPLRMAYAALWQYDLLDHPAAARVVESLGEAAEVCDRMIERGINCPMTSSAGRLLDAVSALLGVCEQPSDEGESAILLEAAAGLTDESYGITLVKNTATEQSTAHDTSVILLDAEPLFKAVLDDMQADVPVATIAAKVHNAMIAAIVQSCLVANAAYGISIVALAGGVFMNRLITEGAIAALEGAGFTVALGKELPPNDGAISYGQAAVAAARANQQAS